MLGLSQTSNHQHFKHLEGVVVLFKMYKHMLVNEPYVGAEKRYPDEFPQVYYADEPHYDCKPVRCLMSEGERGMLTLRLLLKHFYVYLCSLFEHITENDIDPYVASMLYQGPATLVISRIDYAPEGGHAAF